MISNWERNGRDGRDGPQGRKGERGFKGDKGDPGIGLQGARGKDGLQGQTGEVGPMPAHRWQDTKLQFEQAPGGEWGKAVDLQGPPAEVGTPAKGGGAGAVSIPNTVVYDGTNNTFSVNSTRLSLAASQGAVTRGEAYLKMVGETFAPMEATTDIDVDGFWDSFMTKTLDTNPAHRIWGNAAVQRTTIGRNMEIVAMQRVFPSPRAAFGVAPVLTVPVFIPDFTKVGSITLILLMGTGKTAYFGYQVGPSGAEHLRYSGMHIIRAGTSDWTMTGGANFATDTITGWNIEYYALDPGTIIIGDWRVNQRSKAQIMLVMDACYAQQYTVFRPLANSLGLKLTYAVTRNNVGQAGFLTLAQLRKCIADGHGLAIRPNRRADAISNDDFIADVKAEQAYLKENFSFALAKEGSKCMVWPNGVWWPMGSVRGDMTLVNRVQAECGVLIARTTDTTNAYGGIPIGLQVPPPNLMIMPILGNYSAQTAASVAALIDVARDRGDGCVYFAHGAGEQATTGGTDATPDFYRQIFEHVADLKSQGLIMDRTMHDFFSNL